MDKKIIFLTIFLITISSIYGLDYSTDTVWASLVDWTTTTTALQDQIGNYDITNNGATINTTGKFVNCDGVADNLTFGQFNLTSPYTMGLWVNQDVKESDSAIFSRYVDGTNRFYLFSSNVDWDERLLINGGGGSIDMTGTTGLNNNQWYPLLITVNSTGTFFYNNNTLVGFDTDSITINFNTNYELCAVTALGAHGNWDGKITQMYFFNKSLDINERTTHINNTQNFSFNPFSTTPPEESEAFVNINLLDELIVNNTNLNLETIYWNLELNKTLNLNNFSVNFNNTGFIQYLNLPNDNNLNLTNNFITTDMGGIEFIDKYHYITDPSNETIVRLNSNGDYNNTYDVSTEIIGSAKPRNLLAINDNLYVFFTDFGDVNYLAKYDNNLSYQSEIINLTDLGIENPQSFFYDYQQEYIYISRGDVGIRDIYKLNKSFSLIDTINYSALSLFYDITRFNDSYYILDSLELKKYDLDFNYESTIKNLFTSSLCTTASKVTMQNIGGNLNLVCFNNTDINLYKKDFNTGDFMNQNNSYYQVNGLSDGNYTIQFQVENSTNNFNSSTYYFTIDSTNPIINNTLPTEINNYNLNISNYVSCTDTNLVSCNITFTPDSVTTDVTNESYNFTYNGNQSYIITAVDIANNTVTETGTILINPIAYFQFNYSGTLLSNYSFGGIDWLNTTANFTFYNSILTVGENNTLEWEKLGYISKNFTFEVLNTSTINITYNVSLAYFEVFFFEGLGGDLLNETNISFTIVGDTFSNNYTATNGTRLIYDFNDQTGAYEITTSLEGYNQDIRFFTFTGFVNTTLNVYLINTTDTTSTKFIIRDTGLTLLSDIRLTIREYNIVTNAFEVLTQGESNSLGEVIFNLDWAKKYQFVLYDGTNTVTKAGQYITSSPIFLTFDPSEDRIQINPFLNIFTDLSYLENSSNNITTFRFDYDDPDVKISQACLDLYLIGQTSDTLISQNCSTSPSATLYIDLIPDSPAYYYVIGTITYNGEDYEQKIYYTKIPSLDSEFSGLGILFTMIVFLFTSLGTATRESPIISILLSIFGLAFCIYFGAIPLKITGLIIFTIMVGYNLIYRRSA